MLWDLAEHPQRGAVEALGSRVPRPQPTDRRREPPMVWMIGVVLTLVLAAAGCSDDSDAASSTSSVSTSPPIALSTTTSAPSTSTIPTTTSTDAPTTTTQPASPSSTAPTTTSAPPPLEPALQELLDRYDAAVTTILADPRVAADPSSAEVSDYLALFTVDSTFAQGALDTWADEGEQGRFYRPGPAGELVDSVLHDVTNVTDTVAEFTVCSASSIEVVDSDGDVIESQGGVAFVEAVAARSENDEWLLRELTQSSGDCPSQGAAG